MKVRVLLEELNLDNVKDMTQALKTASKNFKDLNDFLDQHVFGVTFDKEENPSEPTLNQDYIKAKDGLAQSVAYYGTLDPKINTFVAMLNVMPQGDYQKIKQDTLRKVAQALGESDLKSKFIEDSFKYSGIADLLSEDLEYMINIFKIFSDPRQLRDYKNIYGKSPTFKDLLDGNKFKELKTLKETMNGFFTEDTSNFIGVDDWLKDVAGWEEKDYRDNFIEEIKKSSEYDTKKKQDLEKKFKLYFNPNDKQMVSRKKDLYNNLKVPNNAPTTLVIDKFVEYMERNSSKNDGVDISLKAFFKDKKINDLEDQIEYLKKKIQESSDIQERDKNNLDIKLSKITRKENKALLNKMFALTIVDEEELPTIINDFISEAADQNYLSTTIEDALEQNNITKEQGLSFLIKHLGEENKRFLRQIWEQDNLKDSLLKASIKNGRNGLDFKGALEAFLSDIKERSFDLSLNKILKDRIAAKDGESAAASASEEHRIEVLKGIIDESNVSNNGKRSAAVRLRQLLRDQSLRRKLLNLNIVDESKIAMDVLNFLDANNQVFKYTTVGDALAFDGVNSPAEMEGYNKIREKISSIYPKEEKSKFLSKFGSIWKNPTAKEALLKAEIEFKNGRFNWKKSLDKFLGSTKI